jgi:homoprotocatechuate degradation regulator HpaR
MIRCPLPTARSRTATRKTAPLSIKLTSVALPMELLRAREAMMRMFRPYLHKLGLTDQQGRILRALAEVEWVDMFELSTRSCIHPASLSRIIPRLDERRLVRRRPDPVDGRRVFVSLTGKGRTIQKRIGLHAEKIYGSLSRKIGSGTIEDMHRCLRALIDVLGGPDAAVPSDSAGDS